VAVACNDLSGNGLWRESELAQRLRFDFGGEVRIGAHRAGDLADRHLRPSLLQTRATALHLRQVPGEHDAEGYWFRVDTVGATDHRRARVLPGARREGIDQSIRAREQQVSRATQQDREG